MVNSTPNPLNEDVADIWNRACDAERGVRVRFPTKGDASHFRARLHAFRRDAQSDNRRAYPPTHPAYGKTLFDEFMCKLREEEDSWYVYVERKPKLLVESLDGVSEKPREKITLEITPERKVQAFVRRF